MNDLISRQAMLKHIEKVRQGALMIDDIRESNIIMLGMNLLEEAVRNQPSAQRKGKWIYLNGLDAFECSVCGRQMVRNIFDYCPWCGAEMTKGEEDE